METFRPGDRIRKRREFDAVFKSGRRHSGGFVSLVFSHRADGRRRLGLSISAKVGGSVVRNRLKRWTREVFRRNRDLIPPVDAIVLVSRPLSVTFTEYQSALLSLFGRIR